MRGRGWRRLLAMLIATLAVAGPAIPASARTKFVASLAAHAVYSPAIPVTGSVSSSYTFDWGQMNLSGTWQENSGDNVRSWGFSLVGTGGSSTAPESLTAGQGTGSFNRTTSGGSASANCSYSYQRLGSGATGTMSCALSEPVESHSVSGPCDLTFTPEVSSSNPQQVPSFWIAGTCDLKFSERSAQVSATGNASADHVAVSGTGCAQTYEVGGTAVSGTGCANGVVAVSGTGDADGSLADLSGNDLVLIAGDAGDSVATLIGEAVVDVCEVATGEPCASPESSDPPNRISCTAGRTWKLSKKPRGKAWVMNPWTECTSNMSYLGARMELQWSGAFIRGIGEAYGGNPGFHQNVPAYSVTDNYFCGTSDDGDPPSCKGYWAIDVRWRSVLPPGWYWYRWSQGCSRVTLRELVCLGRWTRFI